MDAAGINSVNCMELISGRSDDIEEEKQNVNVILVPEDIIQALSSSTYDTTDILNNVDAVNHQRHLEDEINSSDCNTVLSNCVLDSGNTNELNDKEESVFDKSSLNLNSYLVLQSPTLDTDASDINANQTNKSVEDDNGNLTYYISTVSQQNNVKIVDNDTGTKNISGNKQEKLNRYTCKYPACFSAFPTRYKLMRHRKIHNRIKLHKCDQHGCNTVCPSDASLQEHKNTHNALTTCDQCNMNFDNELQLIRHLNNFHDGMTVLNNDDNHFDSTTSRQDIVALEDGTEYLDSDALLGSSNTDNTSCQSARLLDIVDVESTEDQNGDHFEASNNELLLYYLCPHKDCGSLFTSVNDAKEHIENTHLQTSAAEKQSKIIARGPRPVSTTLEIIMNNNSDPATIEPMNEPIQCSPISQSISEDIILQTNESLTEQHFGFPTKSCNPHSNTVTSDPTIPNAETIPSSFVIDTSQFLPISSFCIVKTLANTNSCSYTQATVNKSLVQNILSTSTSTTGRTISSHSMRKIRPFSLTDISFNKNQNCQVVCLVDDNTMQESGDPPQKYKCKVFNCNKSFESLKDFLEHGTKHSVTNRYQCEYPACPWSFPTPYKLKRHMKSHDQIKQHKCTYPGCTTACSTKYNLQVHLTVHEEDSSQSRCNECNLYFDYKLQLVKHMRTVHDAPPTIPCSFENCEKKFYTKATQSAHMKIHKNDKTRYVCDFEGCGKSFDRPAHFRDHFIALHSNFRPFPCDHPNCSWKFASKGKLNRHKLTHTGYRKYKCPVENCGKRFFRLEHLRSHLDVHSKDDSNGDGIEAPIESNEDNLVYYLCPYESCGSLFTTLIGAKQHIQKVHSTVASKESVKYSAIQKEQESQPVSITLEAMVTNDPDPEMNNVDSEKLSTQQSETNVPSTQSLLCSMLQEESNIPVADTTEDIMMNGISSGIQPQDDFITNVKSLKTSKEEVLGLAPTTIDPSQFLLGESQDFTPNSGVGYPDSEAMKYINLPQSIYQNTISADRFLNFDECVPTVDPNMVMRIRTPPPVFKQSDHNTSTTCESSDDNNIQCDGNNNHRINSGAARTNCYVRKRKSSVLIQSSEFDETIHSMLNDVTERNTTSPEVKHQTESRIDKISRKDGDCFIKNAMRDQDFAGSTINLSDLA